MQPFPSRGAGLAESIESGQGAFATTTFGQLRTTSACAEPGTLTIGLDGELDIASAPRLGQLLAELERDRWPTVVLDLRHLSFIDSSGIRALLAANRQIGGQGGRLVVRNVSRPVRRTLAAVGVDDILGLTEVLDESTPTGPVRSPQPDRQGPWDSGDHQPPPNRPRQAPSAPSGVSDFEPAGSMLMEVTNAVVAACKTHTGKGPQRAKSHMRPNALYVVLRDWMTVAERALVAHGRQDLIAESRRYAFDQVAHATRSTVEDATNRTVITTRGQINVDRETAILAYTLGPGGGAPSAASEERVQMRA
jgi:stage II sporulation protein AA (anti-sigma F factor antagonist)